MVSRAECHPGGEQFVDGAGRTARGRGVSERSSSRARGIAHAVLLRSRPIPVPCDCARRLTGIGWEFHQDIIWHKCTAGGRQERPESRCRVRHCASTAGPVGRARCDSNDTVLAKIQHTRENGAHTGLRIPGKPIQATVKSARGLTNNEVTSRTSQPSSYRVPPLLAVLLSPVLLHDSP